MSRERTPSFFVFSPLLLSQKIKKKFVFKSFDYLLFVKRLWHMLVKKCLKCKKEFKAFNCYVEVGKGKFCSQKCSAIYWGKLRCGKNHPNWKADLITKPCFQCGKGFITRNSILRKGAGFGKFCSHKCVYDSRRGIPSKLTGTIRKIPAWNKGLKLPQFSGANSPRYKGKVAVKCYKCNKDFEIYPSEIKNTKRFFCSMECRKSELDRRFRSIWQGMKQRCFNKKSNNYKNYGARGILIEWSSLKEFGEDMYDLYLSHCLQHGEKNTSINRIDNNGNYSKENCEWSTRKIQSRNMRTNHLITYNGKTQCLFDWADELGINRSVLQNRIRRKWSFKKAIVISAKI